MIGYIFGVVHKERMPRWGIGLALLWTTTCGASAWNSDSVRTVLGALLSSSGAGTSFQPFSGGKFQKRKFFTQKSGFRQFSRKYFATFLPKFLMTFFSHSPKFFKFLVLCCLFLYFPPQLPKKCAISSHFPAKKFVLSQNQGGTALKFQFLTTYLRNFFNPKIRGGRCPLPPNNVPEEVL